jgi:hypothetical protein
MKRLKGNLCQALLLSHFNEQLIWSYISFPYLQMLDLHGTDSVGGHDVFFDELDLDDPICLYSFLWPIHVTFSLKYG